MFSKSSFILGLALLSSYVAADGCQDCGGYPKIDIYTECVAQCNGALSNPVDSKACSDQCSKLVLEENCCTTTVCPTARRRRSPVSERDLLASVSRENPTVRANDDVEVNRSLEARDGRSCCNGCKALGVVSNWCPVSPLSVEISMAA